MINITIGSLMKIRASAVIRPMTPNNNDCKQTIYPEHLIAFLSYYASATQHITRSARCSCCEQHNGAHAHY